ncbi:hypothetical protein [Desulfatitalea alkaliphila]|uniref:Uncharacterized protein n=1 Tax=Desulfatitalea alkaliphila TaxID=2929485 RepID=A0AA41R7E6_9BACT|nr:hypothetical protein [Desulfatitalea alkaliphila]MCJ8502331.1 hypothetical protein [Desulfatitalea alkaliphila]
MVTYREFSRRWAGYCGIVEGVFEEKPDVVLVRWVGDQRRCEEKVTDLEEL